MICTKVADFLDKIMLQNKEREALSASLIAPAGASPAKIWEKAKVKFLVWLRFRAAAVETMRTLPQTGSSALDRDILSKPEAMRRAGFESTGGSTGEQARHRLNGGGVGKDLVAERRWQKAKEVCQQAFQHPT